MENANAREVLIIPYERKPRSRAAHLFKDVGIDPKLDCIMFLRLSKKSCVGRDFRKNLIHCR